MTSNELKVADNKKTVKKIKKLDGQFEYLVEGKKFDNLMEALIYASESITD